MDVLIKIGKESITKSSALLTTDDKPLELELQMVVSTGNLETKHPGQDKLFVHIMEKGGIAPGLSQNFPSLLEPYILAFWVRGLSPFPHGQVRSRCEQ